MSIYFFYIIHIGNESRLSDTIIESFLAQNNSVINGTYPKLECKLLLGDRSNLLPGAYNLLISLTKSHFKNADEAVTLITICKHAGMYVSLLNL